MEEDNSVLEGQVGEALSIDRVVDSNVVPLTINRFPYPRHLVRTEFVKARGYCLQKKNNGSTIS